ncbi:hypothetical protein IFM89_035391 [Coptis chinensis]|uniref:RNase H type-1 domain-containing protein n=1 Tax=Coptis chinensis TaxID=261450 RepID=A0A835HIT9_9MAGN|nr:hypothetical protein IFM89_035391 [Coptis chinensis]
MLQIFHLNPQIASGVADIKGLIKAKRLASPLIRELWTSAVLSMLVAIWKMRNSQRYNDSSFSSGHIRKQVRKGIQTTGRLSKSHMYNTVAELAILHSLDIECKPKPFSAIQQVNWYPPEQGVIKINCDGCSLGNLGRGGAGLTIRDYQSNLLGILAQGLGVVTNYEAESIALVLVAESAIALGWRTYLRFDVLVHSFPWFLHDTPRSDISQHTHTHTHTQVFSDIHGNPQPIANHINATIKKQCKYKK